MKTALLVIDLQQEFSRRTAAGRARSNPDAELRVAEVLALFRARRLPVVHIHHDDPNPASGFRLTVPTGQVMPCAAPLPGETVIVKHGSSAFHGTGLADHLHNAAIDHLVVIGAAVNFCVASSVRSGADLGFAVTVVSDAVFGFGIPGPDGAMIAPETVLAVTLATLGAGFAKIRPSAAL